MLASRCIHYIFQWTSLILAVLAMTGCAGSPATPAAEPPAGATPAATATHPGVLVATTLLGTPYRYGGSSPRRGFDCSGLVYYAFRETGIRIPRTTGSQLRHAKPVPLPEILPGDLLFFRQRSSRVSHVGIYAGDGWFIHAPSRGKRVSWESLRNSYWKSRLVAAGRYE
jgi:cell wall-associated NlpC family hydrolase